MRGTTGHNTVQEVFAGAARVLLFEKPGVLYLDAPANVESATRAFDEEHTLERWARAAISAACDVAPCDRVIVIGHSEGGVATARVAATDRRVTHVAVLACEGPPQLFSLIALARDGTFFAEHGDTPAAREAWLVDQWAQVLADPDAADRFFFGHPFRRWASFLAASPVEELLHVDIPILVAQGTADRAVTPVSADALYATLVARGKSVRYLRVDAADHNFSLPDRDGWRDVMMAIRRWALADH